MQPPIARTGSTLRRTMVAAAILGLIAACEGRRSGPALSAADSAVDTALRDELIRLGLADQTVRLDIDAALADTGRLRVMLGVDSSLTARLRRIIEERGWPGKSRVGDEAAAAAFLIVQHSPSDAFQREMLPLLEAAAAAGEAEAADVALLTDRVLTHDGRPQRYGTQFRLVEGVLEPYPIEDPAGLDTRRAQVGLPTMEEYVAILQRTYGGTVRVPDPDTSAFR